MKSDAVLTNIGEVSSQLMTYEFEALPVDGASMGEKQAVASARGWIENMLSPDFRPPIDAVATIHRGDEKTCDAVRFAYGAQGYDIKVSQSIFLIVIELTPKSEESPSEDSIERLVNSLSRRLFRFPERQKLVATRREGGAIYGKQEWDKDRPSQEMDWLDAVEWWHRNPQFGFVIPKLAAPNQATIISIGLRANQIWFERYGKPRNR